MLWVIGSEMGLIPFLKVQLLYATSRSMCLTSSSWSCWLTFESVLVALPLRLSWCYCLSWLSVTLSVKYMYLDKSEVLPWPKVLGPVVCIGWTWFDSQTIIICCCILCMFSYKNHSQDSVQSVWSRCTTLCYTLGNGKTYHSVTNGDQWHDMPYTQSVMGLVSQQYRLLLIDTRGIHVRAVGCGIQNRIKSIYQIDYSSKWGSCYGTNVWRRQGFWQGMPIQKSDDVLLRLILENVPTCTWYSTYQILARQPRKKVQ